MHPLRPKAAARFAGSAAQRAWRHDAYRTKLADKAKPTLASVTIAGAPDGTEAAFVAVNAVTQGMALTRTLVAEPANLLYPETFVEQVRKSVEGLGLDITVIDEAGWPSSAWARCSASARGRGARRRCSR